MTLPLPSLYRADNASRWSHRPDDQALFRAARAHAAAHGIRPASQDRLVTHLLLVDLQRDFCHPDGTLFVAGRSGTGAVDDLDRIARFVYASLGEISTITCTMDTHHPFQIFFASFWVDAAGEPVTAFREITTAQIRAGEVRPRPGLAAWICGGDAEWLRRQVLHYCEQLEAAGKYTLYLWPPHCLLGSEGHTLSGVVHEARMFHAFAREAEDRIELKGDDVLTENYSVLEPEVRTRWDAPGERLGRRNQALIRRLLGADRVIVAGEAASHCVKSTLEDLLGEIEATDPLLASRIYILTDCMSAVTVPDGAGGFAADFTPFAEEALARFRAGGMHLVTSATPIAEWPG